MTRSRRADRDDANVGHRDLRTCPKAAHARNEAPAGASLLFAIPLLERSRRPDSNGDPFITSDGPVAAGVSSSHLRPLHIQDLADWRCLGLTRADNLVDVWWTAGRLSGDSPNSESRLSCAWLDRGERQRALQRSGILRKRPRSIRMRSARRCVLQIEGAQTVSIPRSCPRPQPASARQLPSCGENGRENGVGHRILRRGGRWGPPLLHVPV